MLVGQVQGAENLKATDDSWGGEPEKDQYGAVLRAEQVLWDKGPSKMKEEKEAPGLGLPFFG